MGMHERVCMLACKRVSPLCVRARMQALTRRPRWQPRLLGQRES